MQCRRPVGRLPPHRYRAGLRITSRVSARPSRGSGRARRPQEIFLTSKLRTKAQGAGLRGAWRAGIAFERALGACLDLMLIQKPAHSGPQTKYVEEAWAGPSSRPARYRCAPSASPISMQAPARERIIDETGYIVKPAVDQIETHPYFQQNDMLPHLLAGRGIHHGPTPARQRRGAGRSDHRRAIAAAAYGKSRRPRTSLRWYLQRGSDSLIPKSKHARAHRGELRCLRFPSRRRRHGSHCGPRQGRARSYAAAPRPSTTSY